MTRYVHLLRITFSAYLLKEIILNITSMKTFHTTLMHKFVIQTLLRNLVTQL